MAAANDALKAIIREILIEEGAIEMADPTQPTQTVKAAPAKPKKARKPRKAKKAPVTCSQHDAWVKLGADPRFAKRFEGKHDVDLTFGQGAAIMELIKKAGKLEQALELI
jgi:hypothetical protein